MFGILRNGSFRWPNALWVLPALGRVGAGAITLAVALTAAQPARAVMLDPSLPGEFNQVLFDDSQAIQFEGTGEHGAAGEPDGLSGSSVRGLFDFLPSAGGGYFVFSLYNDGSGADAGAISRFGMYLPDGINFDDYDLTLFQVTSSNDCYGLFAYYECYGDSETQDYTLYDWEVSSNGTGTGFPVTGPRLVVDFAATSENLGEGGIQVGETGAFILRFSGGPQINALPDAFNDGGDPAAYWCVRWQGGDSTYNADGDSDAACGGRYVYVDEPGALLIFGMGLINIALFQRRRRKPDATATGALQPMYG